MNNKHHKNICYAPFIHKYIHPNDGPQICCESGELLSEHTPESLDLETHWKSEYYQNIRRRMLAGEKLDICRSCWDLEDDGYDSDRLMYNDKYNDHNKPELDIVKGTEIGKPLDLDIRPSNLCNLKCKMCVPQYSSQLDKESQAYPYLKIWMGTQSEFANTDIMTEENIEHLIAGLTSNSEIKFLGGEPTIMPEVSTILDKLIEINKTNCHISITTNCTNFNNQAMFDKLAKFKSVSAQLSIDGMGKTLEYIRFPVNWKKAQEVMLQWVNITSGRQIHFTLQALNLYNVYDFLFWLAEYNKAIDDSMITLPAEFYILEGPNWASIKNLPVYARHKEVERILSITDPYIIRLMNESQRPLKQCLNTLLEDLDTGDRFRLARASKEFDTARKQHIKDYVPEVYTHIGHIYEQIPTPKTRS